MQRFSRFALTMLRGLYVITDANLGGGHVAIAQAAIAGGAAAIQLRDKLSPDAQLLSAAREIRRLTIPSGVLFIVNDRTDIALQSGADGVHLGPGDLSVREARRILGERSIIGASCGTPAEAEAAASAGASYIGVGPVFATATKSDAGPPIGLTGLREVVHASVLPVAAIGGINCDNIGSTIAAGAAMGCVVSAIARAGDPFAMTAAVRALQEAAEAARRALAPD